MPQRHSFCDEWFLIQRDFSLRLSQPSADWVRFIQCNLSYREAFLDMSKQDARGRDAGFFPEKF